MKTHITHSPTQTKNLAKKIAKNFKGGEVLGLTGDLGSGKTQFTKGLAKYYNIKNPITSPTFVLMKVYPIYPERSEGSRKIKKTKAKQLIHVDCYRLENPRDLLELGISEYLENKNSLVIIEWAEKIKSILPKDTMWIKFSLGKKENERIIKIV